MGQMMIQKALTTGFNWAAPQAAPPQPPESLDAIIAALDEGHKRAVDIVRGVRDEQLLETVKFFVAPKTLGDIPKIEFIWKFLCDQIHHRGQLSIYLRMVDGKVPSIYGPSADEPWM